MAKKSVVARLAARGIALPAEPSKPVGNYVSVKRVGRWLYVSGHGPWPDGKPMIGKLGSVGGPSIQEGYEAARQVGLGVLRSIEAAVGLDNISQLVKTLGMVNCVAEFGEQPKVIDGFSDLMAAAFGNQRGVGTRSAVGMMSLPFGIMVEVECTFRLKRKASK